MALPFLCAGEIFKVMRSQNSDSFITITIFPEKILFSEKNFVEGVSICARESPNFARLVLLSTPCLDTWGGVDYLNRQVQLSWWIFSVIVTISFYRYPRV